MSEEGNAPAPVEAPAETPPAPTALADENGVLREGWLESVDEDLREESYLKEAKDVQSLARSTVHARRMVGKDKMVRPTAESSDEVWEEYHKIGGRPDTALDYAFKRPDDFPEEHYSEEFALATMELFHKIGISSKQATAIFEFNNSTVLGRVKQMDDAVVFNRQEADNKLYGKWGAARDQKVHLGNVAIQEGTKDSKGIVDEEFKERLTKKFGDDPDFIEYSSNLGGKFAEHGVPVDTGIPTPLELDSKIEEEKAKASYGIDYAKHGFSKAQHKAQVTLVSRLFEEKAASTKTG